MAHIVWDTREHKSISSFMFDAYIDKVKPDITHEMKQITTNDFMILVGSPRKLFAVIERKTLNDFRDSMINGRLDNQINGLLELRRKRGCGVFLILEGKAFQNQKNNLRGTTFAQLDAKRRSIQYKGIPIIYTRDVEYTVEQVVLMACDSIKYENGLPRRSNINSDIRDVLLDTCDSMNDLFVYPSELVKEDINNILCDANKNMNDLIEKFPEKKGDNELPIESITPKPLSITAMLYEMWKGIPSVSKRTIPILATKYTLMELFNSDPNDVASIAFDSGRKIGSKNAEKMISGMRNVDVVAEILSGVKGVSKELSKQISRDFTFDKLIDIPDDYQFKGRRIKSKSSMIKKMINQPLK